MCVRNGGEGVFEGGICELGTWRAAGCTRLALCGPHEVLRLAQNVPWPFFDFFLFLGIP